MLGTELIYLASGPLLQPNNLFLNNFTGSLIKTCLNVLQITGGKSGEQGLRGRDVTDRMMTKPR